MLKEEMIYEDAVEVLEKAFKGETVSQINLGIATLILKDVFPKIYEMRVQKEVAKEANEWKDELK